MEKWAIHIDIEGFGATYGKEDQALHSLRALMDGIYRIGSKCYPGTPYRIFAHQIGDGFIIVSEFGSQNLEVPTCIAISLMRHLLLAGGAGKSTIAEGDFADITGCYHQHILDARDSHNRVRLGRGIMTLFPVMGTALIRAVGVDKISPSGSLLLVRRSLHERLPQDIPVIEIQDSDLLSIDWIHAEYACLENLRSKADLMSASISDMEQKLESYMQTKRLKQEWKDNTRKFLSR